MLLDWRLMLATVVPLDLVTCSHHLPQPVKTENIDCISNTLRFLLESSTGEDLPGTCWLQLNLSCLQPSSDYLRTLLQVSCSKSNQMKTLKTSANNSVFNKLMPLTLIRQLTIANQICQRQLSFQAAKSTAASQKSDAPFLFICLKLESIISKITLGNFSFNYSSSNRGGGFSSTHSLLLHK